MKTRSGILLTLLTLVVLACGFFLPQFVFTVQSRREQAGSERYGVEEIMLEMLTEDGLGDVLALVGRQSSRTSLSSGNLMDEAGARKAVLDTMEFFNTRGAEHGIEFFDTKSFIHFNVHPAFVVDESGENAAILWECELLYNEVDEAVVMELDDSTGKMVSLRFVTFRAQLQKETAELWAEACREYYDFGGYSIEEFYIDDAAWHYQLGFMDKEGQMIAVGLTVMDVSNSIVGFDSSDTAVSRAGFYLYFNDGTSGSYSMVG